MLRDRLIFSLVYSNGVFTQSRNFRLQRVGDIHWLENNYSFQKISFSIDELIILNATKNEKNVELFAKSVHKVVDDVFIPVSAGGGIRCIHDADLLFNSGADKVILNSVLYSDPDLVQMIAKKYGAQSIVASVDYRIEHERPHVYIHDGSQLIEKSLKEYLLYIQSLGIGEIMLNSIDKDGTGFGYDLHTIKQHAQFIHAPLIIMGGAGNEKHLNEGLDIPGVSAVATANLFNFIGSGLPNARAFLLEHGKNLARWIDVNI